MSEHRPFETEMAILWQRLDAACGLFDRMIELLVGSPRGFTLMIHPKDPYFATISVTNLAENVEHVRAWLAYMDERKAREGGMFDDPSAARPGSLPTDAQAIDEAMARCDIVHPGVLHHRQEGAGK